MQDPQSYTSLISFGEVLDPASKAAILSVDSQVQMRGMIDNEVQVRKESVRVHFFLRATLLLQFRSMICGHDSVCEDYQSGITRR